MPENVQDILERISEKFNLEILNRQGLAVGLVAPIGKETQVSASFFDLSDCAMQDGIIHEAYGITHKVHDRLKAPLSMRVRLETGLGMRVI